MVNPSFNPSDHFKGRLDKRTVVHVWKGETNVTEVLELGYQVIRNVGYSQDSWCVLMLLLSIYLSIYPYPYPSLSCDTCGRERPTWPKCSSSATKWSAMWDTHRTAGASLYPYPYPYPCVSLSFDLSIDRSMSVYFYLYLKYLYRARLRCDPQCGVLYGQLVRLGVTSIYLYIHIHVYLYLLIRVEGSDQRERGARARLRSDPKRWLLGRQLVRRSIYIYIHISISISIYIHIYIWINRSIYRFICVCLFLSIHASIDI